MRVTKNWLVKHNACSDGMSFVTEHKLIDTDECYFIRQLVKLDKHDWALWLLVHRLDRKDRIRFTVHCAKDVLPIYEAESPDDTRPRKAIEAAEACVIANTKKNRDVSRAAAWEAARAAKASAAAAWAARAVVYAAGAAWDAVWDAEWAAGAAARAEGTRSAACSSPSRSPSRSPRRCSGACS